MKILGLKVEDDLAMEKRYLKVIELLDSAETLLNGAGDKEVRTSLLLSVANSKQSAIEAFADANKRLMMPYIKDLVTKVEFVGDEVPDPTEGQE